VRWPWPNDLGCGELGKAISRGREGSSFSSPDATVGWRNSVQKSPEGSDGELGFWAERVIYSAVTWRTRIAVVEENGQVDGNVVGDHEVELAVTVKVGHLDRGRPSSGSEAPGCPELGSATGAAPR
jgi:hypothetical protein